MVQGCAGALDVGFGVLGPGGCFAETRPLLQSRLWRPRPALLPASARPWNTKVKPIPAPRAKPTGQNHPKDCRQGGVFAGIGLASRASDSALVSMPSHCSTAPQACSPPPPLKASGCAALGKQPKGATC